MQNWSLIRTVLMVFFISVVNCSSVFAGAPEDLYDAACNLTNRYDPVKRTEPVISSINVMKISLM